MPSSEGKNAKDAAQQNTDGSQPPAGHPPAAAGHSSAMKCPFLAAQMSHKNSNVFCKASIELQEDVKEMQADRKGMCCVCQSVGSFLEPLVLDFPLLRAKSDSRCLPYVGRVTINCSKNLVRNACVNGVPAMLCSDCPQ